MIVLLRKNVNKTHKHNLNSKTMSTEDLDENFTHEELMEITSTTLNELLQQDNLLNDLPKCVTLDEVNNQIALSYGQSITVYIVRADGDVISAIVHQAGARVFHLKKAIKKAFQLKLDRTKTKRKISWKYIWKTYYLKHKESENVLTDDNQLLVDLDIRNKTKLTFVKKCKVK